MKTLEIDGSLGEGGGQIVRSALGLSIATGRPFRLHNVRAGRRKPGLLRQHLTAVRAASEIAPAEVDGAELGSAEITFRPGTVKCGDYQFAVGTAGSAILVLQAVLPGLLLADGPSRIVVEGGTHNAWAPPFDFFAGTFLPILRLMGATVSARLERYGFYPAGGGRVVVEVTPSTDGLRPIELLERQPLGIKHAKVLLAQLPHRIAERQLRYVEKRLGIPKEELETLEVESIGPGNALIIELHHGEFRQIFTGFGQAGVSSRTVVKEPIEQARRFLASSAPCDGYLADQLLLPFALAGGGAFRATSVTRHTTTNADVVRQFLDVSIEIEKQDRRNYRVDLQ